MIIETFLYKNITEKHNNEGECNFHKMKFFILILSKIITMILAVYLAWDCNKNKSTIFKILILLCAILFSDIYILFFLIYRILLNNKCN